jgi:hypothetical protein
MIRAMMLSNIVASCAVELSDCGFFVEAESRRVRVYRAQADPALACRRPNASASAPIRPGGIDSLSRVRRRRVNYRRSAFGIYR